jgi:RNA-directed DNA polymerase
VGTSTDKGLILPEKGIPQGAVISPLLANIYLDEFDWLITASTDLKLVRYADDFLVLAQNQERIIEARAEVTQILKVMGLELHSEKTRITNFERGFRFLGHGFLQKAIFPAESPQESDTNEGDLRDKKKSFPKFHQKQKGNQQRRAKKKNHPSWRKRCQRR